MRGCWAQRLRLTSSRSWKTIQRPGFVGNYNNKSHDSLYGSMSVDVYCERKLSEASHTRMTTGKTPQSISPGTPLMYVAHDHIMAYFSREFMQCRVLQTADRIPPEPRIQNSYGVQACTNNVMTPVTSFRLYNVCDKLTYGIDSSPQCIMAFHHVSQSAWEYGTTAGSNPPFTFIGAYLINSAPIAPYILQQYSPRP